MYTLDVICSNGHRFEGWFANRGAFERQREGRLISCPYCSDNNVEQVPTPVRIKRHSEEPVVQATNKAKQPGSRLLKYIAENFEDVGTDFAAEAIRIHEGEATKRNIRGTATPEEEKVLTEEGVSFFKVPDFN